MSANDFILLLDTLEAEGWEVEREDWDWLASHADYHEGYEEWKANRPVEETAALTDWERNR